MKKFSTLGIFGAAFLFLSGPAWGMAKMPPREKMPPAAEAPVQTLDLNRCYDLALKRSEVIAIKKEEIAKTKAQWLKATGEFFGDADFVITDFRQQPQDAGGGESGVGSSLTRSETRTRKFTITQPIFQGFKTLGAVAGAGSLTRQRKEEHFRARDLLFLDVMDAFYQVLSQQKDVETIEGIHALFEERIADLGDREKIGRSRPSEVATAQTRMKVVEADLAASRGALAISRQILEFFTGIPADEMQLDDKIELKAFTEKDFRTIARSRPDVLALKQAVKTAKQAIVVAQSELWPHIDLDHNYYERREGFQSSIDWDLLFTVRVPLATGGTTFGSIKEAVSNWKQAKLAYSLGRRQAELEIKEAYQNWLTSQEKSKSLQDALKASEENFRLLKEDYEHNLVSNLDVLTALEVLFTTSRDANQAQYEMKQNYWRFQTAVGRYPEFLKPQEVEKL